MAVPARIYEQHRHGFRVSCCTRISALSPPELIKSFDDFQPHYEAGESRSALNPASPIRGSSSARRFRQVTKNLSARALMRLGAGLLAFGWGCGDGVSPPAPVATVTIQVTPPVELVPGGTQMLAVLPKDAKGNTLTERITTWTSSDDSKVTVAAGLITGVAVGAATVTATVEGRAATVDVVVKNGAVVSSAGTTFTVHNGAVTVAAPAGAVTQTTNFTVEPAANAPANPRLMPGTAFEFGPSARTFAQPVSITIKYNPANVASDSPESGLQLYELVGSSWRVLPGSTVNLTAKTVTG